MYNKSVKVVDSNVKSLKSNATFDDENMFEVNDFTYYKWTKLVNFINGRGTDGKLYSLSPIINEQLSSYQIVPSIKYCYF